ncbi:MAG: HpaII family restriction endonuclease [Candidatus Paceibacterota bacterium]
MAIKGNKGEWSEFYAFIKILTDGEMFAADKDLNILKEKFFTVLKIIRQEKTGKIFYDISKNNGEIEIANEENKKIDIIQTKQIKNSVANIFQAMKNSPKGSFEIFLATDLMEKLHCKQLKASNTQKADITVVIHDSITPTTPELGFSIKSRLGSPSTLFNASGVTNFLYKVVNSEKKKEEINEIGGASKVMDRSKSIYNEGGKLVFLEVENENLRKNLRKIDSNFSQILAEILKHYYGGKASNLPDLVDCIGNDKEFCEKMNLDKSDFEFKIKNFLLAVALGMTPKKEWDGFTKAHGGYIIVKENGDVVCYHLYNRDEFEEYLYRNTKLDTPSTTRHKFGKIYEENGEKRMKYNLQIRFLK